METLCKIIKGNQKFLKSSVPAIGITRMPAIRMGNIIDFLASFGPKINIILRVMKTKRSARTMSRMFKMLLTSIIFDISNVNTYKWKLYLNGALIFLEN